LQGKEISEAIDKPCYRGNAYLKETIQVICIILVLSLKIDHMQVITQILIYSFEISTIFTILSFSFCFTNTSGDKINLK
jgi:hypothetical protein